MESFKNYRELRFANLAPEVWKKLDEIPRTGWVKRGVKNPETVQEHTVSLRDLAISLFSKLTEFSEEEKQVLIDMLEIHDWPEAIVGDEIVLEDGTEEKNKLKEEKKIKETKAMVQICSSLGDEGKRVMELWLQFEEGKGLVESFARELDKYQAVEKALEFERDQKLSLFQEFKEYASRFIRHPLLVERMNGLNNGAN